MLNIDDLFLILSSQLELSSQRTLMKKIYSSSSSFQEIFDSDFNKLDLTLTPLEISAVNRIKNEVGKIDLACVKRSLEEEDIKFLPYSDERYPIKLKAIDDPPFGLFYKGNLDILNSSKLVAIVGTRDPTNYGIRTSKKIASLLVEQDVVIVSGLASGIDASAHLGALEGGKTVAVLGTGIDIIFPATNRGLFNEILVRGGLILSEYPPRTSGMPWNFPQRNRIISALSDAVVVIEGNVQSGALITARFAIKQNKPLFALPGPIDNPTSNGPNILIKARVAELLTSVSDILEKIGGVVQIKFDLKEQQEDLDGLSESQKHIYSFISNESTSFDHLLVKTNLTMQELIKHLSILELKGFVEKTIDGGYSRL